MNLLHWRAEAPPSLACLPIPVDGRYDLGPVSAATTATTSSETAEPALWRRLAGEFVGTFALVAIAAGADAAAALTNGDVTPAARAVAPALTVMALIYAIGDVSGAHFNPAVTAAFAMRRLFPARLVLPYWLAQLTGALVAAGVVRLLLGSAAGAAVSTPKAVTDGAALAIEIGLTAILVTVILGTADRHRVVGSDAALAVGATIALCGLVALPLEGASMNPARSIGPAVIAGQLQDLWIYVAGPLVGGAAAVLIAFALHGSEAGRGP